MLINQLRTRRTDLKRPLQQVADLTGINRSYLSTILSKNADTDVRASTVEAMAAALEAQWVLVPKHLMPEVERLLSGKTIGPDQVPSAMERLLGAKFEEKPEDKSESKP